MQHRFEFYNGPVNQPFQGFIPDLAQDKSGYLWIANFYNLVRFDGVEYVAFPNPNHKVAPNLSDHIECMAIDSTGIIWIGYLAGGLESFDPESQKFTQYQHNNDPASLSNDTVAALLVDDQNRVWVGTHRGLNLFDRETSKFKHYLYSANDTTSLSDDQVRALYMDRNKDIWVGTRNVFPGKFSYPNTGGLNRLDKKADRFTRFMHDPQNPNTIAGKHVRAMFEDSHGNFWVGTSGSGINLLDRKTGLVKRYYSSSDSSSRQRLQGLVTPGIPFNQITFITEDGSGALWFGKLGSGISRLDPITGKYEPSEAIDDPESGLKITTFWRALVTRDGNLWMSSLESNSLIKYDPFNLTIPFQTLRSDANSFYEDPEKNIWIANSNGLIKKNPVTGKLKKFFGDSISNFSNFQSNFFNKNAILVIRPDAKGNIWLGKANDGIEVFDPRTEKVIDRFPYNTTGDKGSIDSSINMLLFADNDHLWIGTTKGLDLLSIPERKFTHFIPDTRNPGSIVGGDIYCLTKDEKSNIWISGNGGISRFNASTDKFKNYLNGIKTKAIYVDADQQIWAGTDQSFYKYDADKDEFRPYIISKSVIPLRGILSIIEDNDHQLWISTQQGIFKMNKERNELFLLGTELGIIQNTFNFADNMKTSSGNILFGYQSGFYEINPKQQYGSTVKPNLLLTDFKLGTRSIFKSNPTLAIIEKEDSASVSLDYNENIFSIDFNSIQFRNADNISYEYRLVGYDNEWHRTGDRRAFYFNVSPGDFVFEVRAFSTNGIFSEKKLLIHIDKPWWQRWWAYVLFAFAIALAVWSIVQYRSRALIREKTVLEKRVKERTVEVVKQKEEISIQRDEIEKTLNELKAAQDQLIQKEKMASLGELTAGIAHEIQNPLNFVNNFSDVNRELIDDLNEELDRGNTREVKIIAENLRDNESKINHHGKRADAIVKSMLQHSRASTGQKELTDINALAEEYLRLSYHGLRAKDKSFNSSLQIELDPTISKINIISQDMGRVFLNLFNNAFYSVSNRQKKNPGTEYSPAVSLYTKKSDDHVIISIKDNGGGIPWEIRDKIFQPFFTTKPTGEGTGLGLSLAYDIIKAHGGQLQVNTEQEGIAEFIIQLP